MNWVAEGILNRNQPWQNWKPKYFSLKGSEVCIYDTPPVSKHLHTFDVTIKCPLWAFSFTSSLPYYPFFIVDKCVRLQQKRANIQSIRSDVSCNQGKWKCWWEATLLSSPNSWPRVSLFLHGNQTRSFEGGKCLAQSCLSHR